MNFLPHGPLVTIRRIDAMEAQLAQAKLESSGIPSFIADANMGIMHPVMQGNVQLQVREEDVARAEQVLSLVPEDSIDEDAPDSWAEETFRCPKCHRKPVELIPLTNAGRIARLVCIVLLLVPIIVAVSAELAGSSGMRALRGIHGNYWMLWVATVVVVSLSLLWQKRQKRCPNCGHEWS